MRSAIERQSGDRVECSQKKRKLRFSRSSINSASSAVRLAVGFVSAVEIVVPGEFAIAGVLGCGTPTYRSAERSASELSPTKILIFTRLDNGLQITI